MKLRAFCAAQATWTVTRIGNYSPFSITIILKRRLYSSSKRDYINFNILKKEGVVFSAV